VLTLADKLEGTYLGEYKYKEIIKSYWVKIEKVSATKVRIAPFGSGPSADF
jgi:hypothetical protein